MSMAQLLNIFPGSPLISAVVLFIVAVFLLYLARNPTHKAIKSMARVMHSGMRIMSRSLLMAERKLVERNREVLLTAGAESAERFIEREFHRVDAVVRRDLSGYPAIQRALAEQIAKIDEDYQESTELPLPPPDWVKAVETLATLPSNGDSWVANILGEVHKTAISQYKNGMEEYRKAVAVRHGLLEKMMPYWRKLSLTLDDVSKTITGLFERARIIDHRMKDYEEIRNKTDKAVRRLTSSSMTQFFISALVLLIAIGGAVINFNLIALPMWEMVGGGSYIGSYKTSDIAALVIILVEVAMGLYLMESLRITNLFPMIWHMDDKMRHRMIVVTFSILFILASVEAGLAFMRDQIAADIQALRQSLAEVKEFQPVNSWIPTVGQMVMGFIFPFALTFVAIPLESFVGSFRTVIGMLGAVFLRWLAFTLRLIGNVALHLGDFLVNIYDLLVFPPLWIASMIKGRERKSKVLLEEEASP